MASGQTSFTRLTTPVFRMSFPNLFKPSAMDENSVPKYGLCAVWTPSKFTEKDKKLWKEMLRALDAESQTAFKIPWKRLPSSFKTGLRDGAEKNHLGGFGEGTRFANLTSKMRPGVVDRDRNPISIDLGNDDEVYPGCYCRATINVYSYNNKGKGVAFGLFNVQKIADGERLDNRVDAADDFDEDIDERWLDQDDDYGTGDDDDADW